MHSNFVREQIIDCPSKSPDINIIENIWAMTKKNFRKKPHTTNLDELWSQVLESWEEVRERSSSINISETMNNRLNSVIAANGGFIKY